jgi:hypothetical protein
MRGMPDFAGERQAIIWDLTHYHQDVLASTARARVRVERLRASVTELVPPCCFVAEEHADHVIVLCEDHEEALVTAYAVMGRIRGRAKCVVGRARVEVVAGELVATPDLLELLALVENEGRTSAGCGAGEVRVR